MLRFFFDGGCSPPRTGQSPEIVVRDHGELRRAVASGQLGARPLRSEELSVLRAVLARLGDEARDVDVVGNQAVFRLFPR